MGRPLFLLFVLSPFLVSAPTSESPQNGTDKPNTETGGVITLSEARSPEALSARIAKLLVAATRSDLDRLVSASDCTTALAAGWERVRRTVPQTLQKDVVALDSLAVSRFLGLVEGRLKVPVPKAWAEVLGSGKGHARSRIWFSAPLDLVGTQQVSGGWLIKRDGAGWLLTRGARFLRLPAEFGMDPDSHPAVELSRERAYAAVYSSLPESSYKLFAIDQVTGKVVWSAEVWGTIRAWPSGVVVGHSGHDSHAVTIHASDEKIVVFGVSGFAVYAEVFDRKTGENRCRFSTARAR